MTDFNFTLGSRWQSKGAGIVEVRRAAQNGEAEVSTGNGNWYWMDSKGEAIYDDEEFNITGPAEPLHTPPAGKLTADDPEIQKIMLGFDDLKKRCNHLSPTNSRIMRQAINKVKSDTLALLSERARRAGGAG